MEPVLEIPEQEPKLRRRRSEYRVPGYRVALVREAGFPFADAPCFTTPSAAGRFFVELFRSRQDDREVFVTALLNVRHGLIGYSVVSVGCLTSALVHPREAFKPALLAGAAAVIVAHNHPSGDVSPSAEDVALTRRLVSAGQLLGVEVLDHIITGHDGFRSLKDAGLL
jgi:DNA repair protein RadC